MNIRDRYIFCTFQTFFYLKSSDLFGLDIDYYYNPHHNLDYIVETEKNYTATYSNIIQKLWTIYCEY